MLKVLFAYTKYITYIIVYTLYNSRKIQYLNYL